MTRMICLPVLCILLVLVPFPVFSAIDCPGGVFLSPTGNDTTGNGTLTKPFQSFSKALEHLHAQQQQTALVCLLPGSYTDEPSGTSTLPFSSITVAPADISEPWPVILSAGYFVETSSLEIYNLIIDDLLISVDSNCNLNFHDLSNASDSSRIDILLGSPVTVANAVFERIKYLGVMLESNQVLDGSALITDSILKNVNIYYFSNFTLSNSVLQSYLSIHTASALITNCNASHITLKDQLNFLSIYPIQQIPNRNFTIQSNNFINITLQSSFSTITNLILINDLSYNLVFQDNYFSCNEGVSGNLTFNLPLLPGSATYDGVKAVVVGNKVDQQCPIVCQPGSGPTRQGLTCDRCPSNFVSPNGKECFACPPGQQNPYNNINCTQCSPGYYNPSFNSSCKICETGTPNQNSTACIACPPLFYPQVGQCVACDSYDYLVHSECPQCSFFQEPPGCTQFSVNGMIVVGCVGGAVLVFIVGIAVTLTLRRRKYVQLQ